MMMINSLLALKCGNVFVLFNNLNNYESTKKYSVQKLILIVLLAIIDLYITYEYH